MEKTVVIAGAGDQAGIRLAKDFLKKGYRVFAAHLSGQQPCPVDGVEALEIDPMSQESADKAAEAVKARCGSVDMMVVNYDSCPVPDLKSILDQPDYPGMVRAYEYNSIGPLRAIEAFLPLLKEGAGKRVCAVTSLASSNNAARGFVDFPGHVSKAPLNMALNQLFNGLRPEGFTFRVYCKDPEAGPDKAGEFAVEYFTRNRSNEPESYKHSDENRLVMRDWMGIEIPW